MKLGHQHNYHKGLNELCVGVPFSHLLTVGLTPVSHSVLNVKAQEKAIAGALVASRGLHCDCEIFSNLCVSLTFVSSSSHHRSSETRRMPTCTRSTWRQHGTGTANTSTEDARSTSLHSRYIVNFIIKYVEQP